MAQHRRVSWIRYFPEDLVNGVALLSPVEELAYRRILDWIVITRDTLKDNDEKLQRITRSGRQWKAVKAVLVELGKIRVEDGYIRNTRMSETVQHAIESSERQAGKARKRFFDTDGKRLTEEAGQ